MCCECSNAAWIVREKNIEQRTKGRTANDPAWRLELMLASIGNKYYTLQMHPSGTGSGLVMESEREKTGTASLNFEWTGCPQEWVDGVGSIFLRRGQAVFGPPLRVSHSDSLLLLFSARPLKMREANPGSRRRLFTKPIFERRCRSNVSGFAARDRGTDSRPWPWEFEPDSLQLKHSPRDEMAQYREPAIDASCSLWGGTLAETGFFKRM
ncbi:hypothetical protein B0H11DRAFT_2199739 [Mycena galericulata]|nr:hypothetical protein B0H11DRAFT_2199739 [Mycena galericulata]